MIAFTHQGLLMPLSYSEKGSRLYSLTKSNKINIVTEHRVSCMGKESLFFLYLFLQPKATSFSSTCHHT